MLLMSLQNQILNLWSKICTVFGRSKDRLEIPQGYNLVKQDVFDNIDYNYWRWNSPNGQIKTNDLKVYWDGVHSMKAENNTLYMSVDYNPKVFRVANLPEWQRRELNYREIPQVKPTEHKPVIDTNPIEASYVPGITRIITHNDLPNLEYTTQYDAINIPYSMGFLHSSVAYKYGIFVIDAKLPKGVNLWPAFWTCGVESWPPEIDIFEGYNTDDTVCPNTHYGTSGDGHKQTHASNIKIPSMYDEFHEYAVHWTKDFIKMYYDGHLVYSVTDKKILNQFSEGHQSIILNCNIESISPIQENPTKTPFLVKNLRIYQEKPISIVAL